MLWLVQTYFARAGDPESSDQSKALIFYSRGELNPPRFQSGDSRLDVAAHEEQLVPTNVPVTAAF
jgi:hypothetical protein